MSVKFTCQDPITNVTFKPDIPIKADNTTFFKLATENLLQGIKDVINPTLNDKIIEILLEESFDNNFGGVSYTYKFNDFSTVFNSSLSNVSFGVPRNICY